MLFTFIQLRESLIKGGAVVDHSLARKAVN